MQDEFEKSREHACEIEHGKMPVWILPSIFITPWMTGIENKNIKWDWSVISAHVFLLCFVFVSSIFSNSLDDRY